MKLFFLLQICLFALVTISMAKITTKRPKEQLKGTHWQRIGKRNVGFRYIKKGIRNTILTLNIYFQKVILFSRNT